MNGRAYDYNLGRFYGVDPIIQFPTNSQSLNGYSYLMNNPLAGTDPTGYATCDVKQASSCLENGVNTIMDGDKKLGVVRVSEKTENTMLVAVSLNAEGRKWLGSNSLENGGTNIQGPKGSQNESKVADEVGKQSDQRNTTVGDVVYENRNMLLVGIDPDGRNLGEETRKTLIVSIPCTLSGPAMVACATGGSYIIEKFGTKNPDAAKVGLDMMAPGVGSIVERVALAVLGKAATVIGRAAMEAAKDIKVPSAPVPQTATVMQHPGSPTHFSILLSGGEHSHQVVTGQISTAIVTTGEVGAGTVLRSTTIQVSAEATTAQAQMLRAGNLGAYNKITNSCVTHVCDVLKAGGVDVPDARGSAQLRFLLNSLDQQ
jgi:hypothetical protein